MVVALRPFWWLRIGGTFRRLVPEREIAGLRQPVLIVQPGGRPSGGARTTRNASPGPPVGPLRVVEGAGHTERAGQHRIPTASYWTSYRTTPHAPGRIVPPALTAPALSIAISTPPPSPRAPSPTLHDGVHPLVHGAPHVLEDLLGVLGPAPGHEVVERAGHARGWRRPRAGPRTRRRRPARFSVSPRRTSWMGWLAPHTMRRTPWRASCARRRESTDPEMAAGTKRSASPR